MNDKIDWIYETLCDGKRIRAHPEHPPQIENEPNKWVDLTPTKIETK